MSNYVFNTKAELVHAVDTWVIDENAAKEEFGDINSWDVSRITDFSNLFYRKYTFNSNISNWDVSNGTTFSKMFYSASEFNQDLSSWDVSSGTNFSHMFAGATAFNQDIGSWDVSSSTSFYGMFKDAYVFNQDIGSWDVSSGTNFSSVFYDAYAFNQDIGSWDVSSGTDFTGMFRNDRERGNTSFNQDIGSWDVSSGTDFTGMFSHAYLFNQDIGSWDVSSGTNFNIMFSGATAFNQDISDWDVSSGTIFTWMFYDADAFNQDISGWDVSSGEDFAIMFNDADAFDQDISSWNVSGTINAKSTSIGSDGVPDHFYHMFRKAYLMQGREWSETPSISDFFGQTITGDSSAETIDGGNGNDVLSGLDGNDTISGGDGRDKIIGGSGNDLLYGGIKDDKINGGLGNDEIYGGDGSDTVIYGDDNNTVNLGATSIQDTGEGFDKLNSIENINTGSGNDQITGNSSNNIIKGGSGTDTFIFSSNRKDYEITNFSSYLTIKDLRDGSPDGTDNLYSIEKLQFSGATYSTSDLFLNPANHSIGSSYTLVDIRDYDGNLHANTGSVSDATKTSYKYQGLIDVNADGTKEAIYTNKESGRWVTGSINSSTGEIDYSDHGQGGTTRVVGIYIDPLVTSGDVVQGSDHDSQRRFQNDLNIDNLTVKASGDYDSDGFQEVYWKTNDETAYLRALMHADGNIQYANYQSKEQMSEYLNSKGFESEISNII